jgi:hypothetical protein
VSREVVRRQLEKACEHQQPVVPAAAGSPAHNTRGGRFARDPGEYTPGSTTDSVQLTLIPGGAGQEGQSR